MRSIREACHIRQRSVPVSNTTVLILQNIKAPVEDTASCAVSAARKKLKKEGLSPVGKPVLSRQSVDARKRDSVSMVCSVTVEVHGCPSAETLKRLTAVIRRESVYAPRPGNEPLMARPVVIGFGPAGMFAALALAEAGYRPLVLERGGSVEERTAEVERFTRDGILSTESNIQFGAGGAGTFSDGKLVTRINDETCSYVLKRLVELGAPADILVNARPHVGTDLLKKVVTAAEVAIRRAGGEILYRTRADGFARRGNTIRVKTTGGDLEAGVVVCALGHSARDTYRMLYDNRMAMDPKPFSVGVRIEHKKEDIDRALLGAYADKLPYGEYNLSHVEGNRGVYSFCMCPGGEVVGASSEEGGVVTNGMSYHARNGVNSNAALAVSVLPEDYGNDPMQAIAFQRKLERAAFVAGGQDYAAPIATVGDFLQGRWGSEPTRILPTYRNGHCRPADLGALLPSFVTSYLQAGIRLFGRRIAGYDAPDAILTGVETRTSAPLRIRRTESGEAPVFPGFYPCGEGAGYAGGITSAAVDGLKTAAHIIERYRPLEKN